MAVWQGSEQGQQSAEQAACECRSSCAGRLDMRSQGRVGDVDLRAAILLVCPA